MDWASIKRNFRSRYGRATGPEKRYPSQPPMRTYEPHKSAPSQAPEPSQPPALDSVRQLPNAPKRGPGVAGPNTKPKPVGPSTHEQTARPSETQRAKPQDVVMGRANGAPTRPKQVKAVNRPQGERITARPALPTQATDDTDDFDLRPQPRKKKSSSLDVLSEALFSEGHLDTILQEPQLFARFTAFLNRYRPQVVPILVRYLEIQKAVKAVEYANAVAQSLAPLPSEGSSKNDVTAAHIDPSFGEMRQNAFEQLVSEALPAYVTYNLIKVATEIMVNEITGRSTPIMKGLVSGLSEVFCLTDPKQEDNPIIYASEGFYQMTGYTRDFVIGTNCRFLQGPKTQHHSVRRLRQAVGSGQELSEALLNYRRDGRPFMNVLMIAPLHDNKGNVKYHIGAQIDVSGLIEGGKGLDTFERYLSNQHAKSNYRGRSAEKQPKPSQGSPAVSSKEAKKKALEKLGELSDMFGFEENAIVAQRSRSNSRDRRSEDTESTGSSRSRRVFAESSESESDEDGRSEKEAATWSLSQTRPSGKLPGVYESYFLMRPSPSLKIIFASPALRKMGNLVQSAFLSHVTAPPATLKGLKESFEAGNPVTAKVMFSAQASKSKDGRQFDRGQGKKDIDEKISSSKMGRTYWVSATPLLGGDDEIGVWMVVLVDQRSLGSDTSYMRSHDKSQSITPSRVNADQASEATDRVGPESPSTLTSKITRPSHINLPDRMGIQQEETRPANSMNNVSSGKGSPEPRKSPEMPQRAKSGHDVMERRDERLDHKQHPSSPSPPTPKRNKEYTEEPNEFAPKYEPRGMFVKPTRVHLQPDTDEEDGRFTLGTEQETGNNWDLPVVKDRQRKAQVAKGSVPGDEADANTEKESNVIPRTEPEKIADDGVEDRPARSQPQNTAVEQTPEKGSDAGSNSTPEVFGEPTSDWRSGSPPHLALEPLTEQALKTHNAEWPAETYAIAPVEVPHALLRDEMDTPPANQVQQDPQSGPDPPVLTKARTEEGEFKPTNVTHNDGPDTEHGENDDNTITAPDWPDSAHEADEPTQSQTDPAGNEAAAGYMDYLLHPGSRPGSRRAITVTNLHSQGRTMADLEENYWERHEDPHCDMRTPFSVD